jgi:hypothetical protein
MHCTGLISCPLFVAVNISPGSDFDLCITMSTSLMGDAALVLIGPNSAVR